jgi:hypothetical protein
LHGFRIVMAGLVPAIHVLSGSAKNVNVRAFASPKRLRPHRRDKPGHDGVREFKFSRSTPRGRVMATAFRAIPVCGIALPRQKTKAFS